MNLSTLHFQTELLFSSARLQILKFFEKMNSSRHQLSTHNPSRISNKLNLFLYRTLSEYTEINLRQYHLLRRRRRDRAINCSMIPVVKHSNNQLGKQGQKSHVGASRTSISSRWFVIRNYAHVTKHFSVSFFRPIRNRTNEFAETKRTNRKA